MCSQSERRQDPAIIGYVQINGINSVHRSAEIGIRIGEEKHRGQGYGKEALRLAVEFCWNHLNLNRVQLVVFKHNVRAISAYKAVGFRKEGVLRKAAFIGGGWVDLCVMAALRPAPARQRKLRVPAPVMAALADVQGRPEIVAADARLPVA